LSFFSSSLFVSRKQKAAVVLQEKEEEEEKEEAEEGEEIQPASCFWQEPIGDLFPLIFFMQEDDCILS
jgi:hypothetical protein